MCLEDCQRPCIKSLINDYKTAGGVCAGSYNFGGDPISPIPCVGSYSDITQGLCSEETERLLLEEECRKYVWFNNEKFYGIVYSLVRDMCTNETWYSFVPGERAETQEIFERQFLTDTPNHSRLLPVTSATSDYGGYAQGISDLNNTRNRYSWICSLRKALKKHDNNTDYY